MKPNIVTLPEEQIDTVLPTGKSHKVKIEKKTITIPLQGINIVSLEPFGTKLNTATIPKSITEQIKRPDIFAVMSHIMIKERIDMSASNYADLHANLKTDMDTMLGETLDIPSFTSDIKTYTYHLTNIFNTFKHIDRINRTSPQTNNVYYLTNNTTIKFLLYKLHTDPLTTGDGNRILTTALTTEFTRQPYFKSNDDNNLQQKVDLFDIAIINRKPAIIYSFENKTNPRMCTPYNIEDITTPISQTKIAITFPFKDNLTPTFKTSLKYTSLLGYFLILAGSYLNTKEFSCKSLFIRNTFGNPT
jgi:hypothetical protein